MSAQAVGSLSHRSGRTLLSRRAMALALLLVGLLVTAAGVADRMPRLESVLLYASAAAGLLLGWAVAATRLRARIAALLSFVLGAGSVLGRVGRLHVQAVELLRSLGGAWWTVVQSLLGLGKSVLPEDVPDLVEPILGALQGLGSDLLGLLERVARWAAETLAGSATFDPVSSTVVWSLALWAAAAWAGWMLRRRERPLAALAPAAVLLTGALRPAEGRLWHVLTLLAALLLLLALSYYDRLVRRWDRDRVGYPDVRVEMAFVSIGLTFVLVAGSAAAATIDLEEIREALERPSGEATDGEDAAPGGTADPDAETAEPSFRAGVAGLPRTHVLGPAPEFFGQPVMRVGVGLTGVGESAPGYWRSVTYDWYTGAGWIASDTGVVDYAAGQALDVERPSSTRLVRQEVEILADLEDALFAVGSLLVVDRDYSVVWRTDEDQFGASTEAESYVAESFVSVASVEELRSAGDDYPGWLAQRYLALPDSLPDRVLALARDLTATEPTPYDRVQAIEDYLRGYEYSLAIGQPPRGRDVVDYFLFDLRKGFCDYYATAMAVLVRAAGVPARIAVGYTGGTFDRATARFLVYDSNAHSWVEVYFPGYGWAAFEPTAAVDAIDRAADAGGAADRTGVPADAGFPLQLLANLPLELIGLVLLGAALTLGIVWIAVDGTRLRRGRPAAAAATLYRRLRRHGRRLSVPMSAGDTAHEFAASFSDWLAGKLGRWQRRVLRPTVQQVEEVIRFYVQASYASSPASSSQREQALRSWRALSWRLWLARMGRASS